MQGRRIISLDKRSFGLALYFLKGRIPRACKYFALTVAFGTAFSRVEMDQVRLKSRDAFHCLQSKPAERSGVGLYLFGPQEKG